MRGDVAEQTGFRARTKQGRIGHASRPDCPRHLSLRSSNTMANSTVDTESGIVEIAEAQTCPVDQRLLRTEEKTRQDRTRSARLRSRRPRTLDTEAAQAPGCSASQKKWTISVSKK